ncbi:HYR-like domain-containing protein [Tenacibaculum sp. M341]|uniref:HYR-like domain-containing protein n=3 Tax=Tenacibaculum TaxID=104267 RepID=UPI001FB2964A|nr:gliding motility-associated C-terminal domain-containing protein [Tenacibaculum sp. M341]
MKQQSNNQAIRQQAFYLSTPVATPFDVDIFQGTNTTAIATVTISNAAPGIYNLADGDNNITLVTDANTGVKLMNSGLRFESVTGEEFYVNYRGRSSSQAASLTTKGSKALGKLFKWGGIPLRGGHSTLSAFVGIMATEDDTTIDIVDYDPASEFRNGADPDGIKTDAVQIVLDKGETYVLQALRNLAAGTDDGDLDDANVDGWLGATILSDKNIAISNGGLNIGVRVGANGRDAAIDQPVAENAIGQEYVFIRGNGATNNETEFPIIIATQDGTDIFVNGSVTPIATIDTGEYFEIPGSNYSSNTVGANMYVRTSRDAYAYQVITGDTSYITLGLNFIAPVNCLLPSQLSNIPNIRDVAGVNFTGGVTIVASQLIADGDITVTDGTGTFTGGTDFTFSNAAGSTWKTAFVNGLSGDVEVNSTGPIAVGFLGASGAAGIAGYFSGFDTIPAVEVDITGGGCFPGSDLREINGGFANYAWYKGINELTGTLLASGPGLQTFNPNASGLGEYFVRVTDFGGCEYNSAVVSLYSCDPDLQVTKVDDVDPIDAGSNVTFTITARSSSIDPMTNVVLTDVLPTEFDIVSATPEVGTWSAPNWTIGTMIPGDEFELVIVARAKDDASGTVTNSVSYNFTEISTETNILIDDLTEAVTINPCNTASLPSSTPTLCVGTILTNITHSTNLATGIASDGVAGANGLPAGVGATWSGDVITISGTPTASGIFNYSIPLTGGCNTVNATGTISVNPLPVADPITGLTEVCEGGTITLTEGTSGTIVWSSSNTAVATINASGVVTGISAGSTNITYTVTDGNGCISNASSVYAVTVNPLPTFTSLTTNTDICEGDDAEFYISGSPLAVLTYNVDGNPNETVTLDAMGDATVVVSSVTTNTTINLVSLAFTSTNCSISLTNTDTVVVNPNPTLASVSDIIVCDDLSGTQVLDANNGITLNPNTSVVWYDAATGGNIIASPIVNTTSPSTDPPTSYFAQITDTSTSCINPTREEVKLQIVSPPFPDLTEETCSSVPLNIGLSFATTYTVASSDPTNVPPASDRTTATIANITDTYSNTTGVPVIVTYSVTIADGSACDGETFDIMVTVSPESDGGTGSTNQVICSGDTPADISVTGIIGSVEKWQQSTSPSFTSFSNVAETSTTFAGSTIGALTQTTFFRAVIKSGTCVSTNSPIITVNVDVTDPLISGTLPILTEEGCDASVTPSALTSVAALEGAGLTISDDFTIDGDLIVTNSDASAAGSCPNLLVITRTYKITDTCGNDTDIVQIINIEDTTSPIVTGTLNAITINSCDVLSVPGEVTTVAGIVGLGGVTAINDACDTMLSVTSSDTNNGGSGCNGDPYIVTRTYTVMDDCGNDTDLVQTITVEDTTAPTGTAPGNITGLQCISDVPASDINLITDEADNCGGAVTVTVADTNNGGSGCNGDPYIVTRTYTLEDCGGLTTDLVQTITVEDTTAPTGTAPVNITGLQCISDVPSSDITLITDEADNCGGAVTVTVADTNNGSSGCNGDPYIVTRTYTLEDCGGLTTDLVQTITVEDTTAPTGTAPANITGLQCVSDVPASDINLITDEADNCGGVVRVTVADTNNGGSGCNGDPYIVTRTYTLEDCGGLTTDLVQTITVEDTAAPTGTAPANITGLQCISDVPSSDITLITDEADNCGGAVTVTVADTNNGGSGCNGDPYIVTRTYTLEDCGGLTTDLVQTITVEDTTAPTGTAPANITGLQCISDVPAGDINLITDEADNCGGVVTVTVADTNNGGSGCNGDPYIVTRTYTLEDCGGLTTDLVQTITVEDTTAPTGTAPANITGLQCILDVPAGDINLITDEADNCGGVVTVTVADTNNGGSGCNGDPYIVTRTYTLEDCGGLTTDLVQTITVEDTTAPTGTTPANITGLQCILDVPAGDITLITDETDNCGGAVTVTVADTNNGGSGCNGDPYIVTRTYTLEDCGGLTTDLVQTITVEDTTAPTGTAPTNITGLQCISDVPSSDITLITDEADNCGGAVTVTVADTNNGGSGCNGDPYIVTRTYTLEDCGGLTTDLVQTITVEDTTAPTGTAPANITGLQCISDVPASDISLIIDEADNCGGAVTVTVADTNNGGSGCNGDPYIVTRTYTLEDCGGLTTDLVQTITIEDTMAPTGTTPANITGLQCISDVPASDITLITDEADNCGGAVTVTVADTNNGGSGCNGDPYIVTRTYTLEDCGGLTTDLVQTITVEDTTAPTGTAPANITGLQCISDVPSSDISLITDEDDNCGGAVTVTVADTNNGGSGCNGDPYIVTRTYTLEDCGGLTTDLVQTITVEDTMAPTGTAPANITGLQCVSDVPSSDITLITDEADNCGGAVTVTVADTNNGGSGCNDDPYIVTRTYTLEDCGGLTTDLVQTITVEDTMAPTGTAPANITGLQCISDVPASDITLITDEADNCGGVVTVTVADTNNGGSGCNGDPYIVTRTYTLEDCGGLTTDLVQTITVEDTMAPTGTAPANITGLQCISDVPASDITLITDEADNCGGGVTVTVADMNNGGSGCNGDPYIVTRTYTLEDCGGLTTDLVQTITVEDTVAPTGTAPANITGLQCISDVPSSDISLITDEADNCGGGVTVTVADANNGGSGCNGDPYIVTRTYTLEDCGGLTTDLVQTITVEDTTAPTGTAPANITGLQCVSDVPSSDITLITDEDDNCGGAVTVTVADTNNGGSGCNGDPYIVTRTYTLEDCGGLTTDLVQIITVEDTTAPTGTAPANITGLQCISDVPSSDITLITDEADNCGGAVTVTVADTNNGGSGCNGDPYIVTRTYTLEDCGGLTTDLVQTITVEDTMAPTGTAPANITGLQCISDVPSSDITLITDEADNCGGAVTVTVADTNNGGSGCNGDPYIVTRTYTLEDCGGLTTDLVQTITVEDTTAPTGTAPANITGLQCISDVPASDITLITDEADNCGGAVTVTVADTNNGGSGCNGDPYIVTRTYTLEDCGGLTTDLVQTITVEDTTAPNVSSIPPTTIACGEIPTAPVATDNCSGTVIGSTSTSFPLTSIGLNVVTWIFEDSCGNSVSVDQEINVINVPEPNPITGANEVCVGEQINLTEGTTGGVYSWFSSDTNIATVDNNGLVTGVGFGTVEITYVVVNSNGCSSLPSPSFLVTVGASTDSDGDGLTDCEESTGIDDPSTVGIPTRISDPFDPCSFSGNPVADISNAIWQTADCDGDGVTNEVESLDGTNPLDGCSFEVSSQDVDETTFEWEALDCDGDGLSNGDEIDEETDPLNPDSDGDGLTDNEEVNGVDDPSTELDPTTYVEGPSSDPNDPCAPVEGAGCNNDTCLSPYNLISPSDGNDENQVFFIRCIDNPEYANNTVEIFNRWGNTVFKVQGYSNTDSTRRFEGVSDGRATVSIDSKLPVGTYYYVIDPGNGETVRTGWLYINR